MAGPLLWRALYLRCPYCGMLNDTRIPDKKAPNADELKVHCCL